MSALTFEMQVGSTSVLELKLGQYMVGPTGPTGQDGPPGPEGTLTPDDTATLDQAVSDAQAAATAASGSAGAAASSATTAGNSATNASTSASNAAGSATAAANSASAAASSAGTASSGATAAGNSATAAGSSQTAAATSATQAANSASAASSSQTAAAGSATSAANSQTAAATSATNAKTSETNAANSATAAAGSASSMLPKASPVIASGALTFADGSQQGSAALSNRNYIVDGNFEQWTGTGVAVGANAFSNGASPMFYGGSGAGGACTLNQGTFVLSYDSVGMTSPMKNYLQLVQSTAATTNPSIGQRIEAVRTLHGRYATFSCWLWCTSGSVTIPSVSVAQYMGSGGSPSPPPSSPLAVVNWNITTVAQRFSVLLPIPSVTGLTLGTNGNDYLSIFLNLPVGSTFTVNTAQWQLEQSSPQAPAAGSPTPFEYRGQQAELARVQRYYETSYAAGTPPGTATGTDAVVNYVSGATFNAISMSANFKVTKRGLAAMSWYSPATGASGKVRDNVNSADVPASLLQAATNGACVSGVMTASAGYVNMSTHWIADARL